jgi:hypothetical protein
VAKASYPKESKDYGAYRWHSAWQIDVVKREARHKSGLVYDFFCGIAGAKAAPMGGRCPSLHWRGELRGGSQALPADQAEHVAIRLCLEACTLFSGMAWDACQDCSKHTAGGDYYMVQHALWSQVHPNRHGMLCLSCLQARLGRRLIRDDFLDAPINQRNRAIEAILVEPTLKIPIEEHILSEG